MEDLCGVETLGDITPHTHRFDAAFAKLLWPLVEWFVSAADTGTIPVYVYKPSNQVDDAPIFVYFHGGGMVLGCRENVQTTCQIISKYFCFVFYN